MNKSRFAFVSVPVIALAFGTVATHAVDDGGGPRADVNTPQAATASVAAAGLSGLDSIDFEALQRSVQVVPTPEVSATNATTAAEAAAGLSGIGSIDFDEVQRRLEAAGLTGQPDTPERRMAAIGLAGIESIDFEAVQRSR
jgi:hypothetical protein